MIGMQPSEAKRLSLWEYGEIVSFWADVHNAGRGGMSEEDKDDLWDWMQAKPDVPLRLPKRLNSRRLNGN